MKKLGLIALLAGTMLLSACHTSAPLQLVHESNMQNVDLGSGRMRKGRNCSTYILGFIGRVLVRRYLWSLQQTKKRQKEYL